MGIILENIFSGMTSSSATFLYVQNITWNESLIYIIALLTVLCPYIIYFKAKAGLIASTTSLFVGIILLQSYSIFSVTAFQPMPELMTQQDYEMVGKWQATQKQRGLILYSSY
jgi:hypothetical protein